MGRKIPIGVVLGAALLLAAGVGGAIWVTGQGGRSVGETARLVPADVALYVTVNTDPASRQWIQMRGLLERLGAADQAEGARDQGLGAANVDWDDDLAPFLGGEATVAARRFEDGEPPGVLAVLSTRDGRRAWEHTVELLDQSAGRGAVQMRTYRGTTIRSYSELEPLGALWIARKDSYLLLGTADADAEVMLDLAEGKGESLAGLDRFRKARAAVADDSLFFLYANPAGLSDAAGLAYTFGPGLSPDALDAGGLEKTALALALSAERTGLRLEWQAVGLDPASNPVALKAGPADSRYAGRVPAETLVFAYGADLYSSFLKGSLQSIDRAGPDARRELNDLNRDAGIDLERDVLARFTGEYAVAVGATEADPDSASLLAFSGVKDGAALGRALAKVEEYARRQGETVSTTKAGGRTVTQIGDGGATDSVVYTIDGDELIAASDLDTLQRPPDGATLDKDPDYRDALKALPSGRGLTVFVNLARLIALAPDAAEAAGDVNLGNLRSLALAFTQQGDRVGGVAFLRIAGE